MKIRALLSALTLLLFAPLLRAAYQVCYYYGGAIEEYEDGILYGPHPFTAGPSGVFYSGYNYDEVYASGPITAYVDWDADPNIEPPPKHIIVQELMSVGSSSSTGTPTASTGITGQSTSSATIGGFNYASASVARYRVIDNPGTSFTISFNPSVSAVSPTYSHEAGFHVDYTVNVGTVTLVLDGGIADSSGAVSRRYLIGQQVHGELLVPFNLTINTTTSPPDWGVSGGEPFGTWSATRSLASAPLPQLTITTPT